MDKGGRFREDLPARRPGRLWGIRHQQGLGFLSTPCFFSLTDILVSKPGKDLKDTSLDTRRVLPFITRLPQHDHSFTMQLPKSVIPTAVGRTDVDPRAITAFKQSRIIIST